MAKKPNVPQETKEGVAMTGFVPKVLRVLTLPQLALALNVSVYVQFKQAFKDGRLTGKAPEGDNADEIEQPREVQVIDLRTGQLMGLVVGHALYQILAGAYPDDSYVGRGFDIMRSRAKRSRGGSANTYNVAELDLS